MGDGFGVFGLIFAVLGTLAPKGVRSGPGSAKMKQKLPKWSQKGTKIEVKWSRKDIKMTNNNNKIKVKCYYDLGFRDAIRYDRNPQCGSIHICTW